MLELYDQGYLENDWSMAAECALPMSALYGEGVFDVVDRVHEIYQ